MALSEGVVKKIVLSYTYVAIWIFLSFTVIVYNKYILDRKMYNWPYPISLTMIHMAFCSSIAYLLVRVFKVVEPVSMSRDLYLRSVVPIGALYSLSLWFSNSAYIYLSVSFIQMLKALMPVAVYSIGVLLKKDGFRSDTMANMVSISVGVAIAAYGEARFDSWGVTLQLGAVAFEATRLVMIQILLTSKGITLNPITSLYYVAPCCLFFLSVPWFCGGVPLVVERDLEFPFRFLDFRDQFGRCVRAESGGVFAGGEDLGVDYECGRGGEGLVVDCIFVALKGKEAQKKAQPDEEAGRLLEDREGDGAGRKNESQT
ncbi:nucleotide-sugar transporter family protein [Actinidia rufa]|uniref:Nucleotide-sugar transporter family protein n=1 Tax=Actinidia rufa TaxID=165716 RepID=A0A7J0FM20_9ERIC|nr:nucleotide-sugar transporter family protein [Actinidia rufa]